MDTHLERVKTKLKSRPDFRNHISHSFHGEAVKEGSPNLNNKQEFGLMSSCCLRSCQSVSVSRSDCPTLGDSMACSPGSSVGGILQARRRDWVVIASVRGSS